MRKSVSFTWMFALVLVLLAGTWLVAERATRTIWDSLQTVVIKDDTLNHHVDAITKAMEDQENGLRGYFLTSDPRFLQPYQAGQRALPAAFQLAAEEGGTASERRSLKVVHRRATAWRLWAVAQLHHWQAGHRTAVLRSIRAQAGKRRFDAFRGSADGLTTLIQEERQQALQASRHTFLEAQLVVGTATVTVMLVVVLLAWRTIRLFRREQMARQRAEDAAGARARLAAIVESSDDAIIGKSLDGIITTWNSGAERLYGYSANEMIGHSIEILFPAELRDELPWILAQIRRGIGVDHLETTRVTKQEEHIEVSLTVSPIKDEQGVVVGAAIIGRDITERKRLEADIRHQALHDALTKLPNRILLRERLNQALHAAHRNGTSAALLLLDLDRFKEVNDTFGHHYGDQLLEIVASRLRSRLRETDTVARLGGDEFAVVLADTGEYGVVRAAQEIHDAMLESIVLDGDRLDIRASIGIALYPAHSSDAVTLLRQADIAMYAAKRGQIDYAFYDPSQAQHTRERLVLINDLRRAIKGDELVLHYQPKADLRSECVNRVEALVRWEHPRHGIIPPEMFIPVAEETGLITPLTHWVLRHALSQCRLWRDNGLIVRVAINLSAHSLHDRGLLEVIRDVLSETHLDPSVLDVEVTESVLMTDPTQVVNTLSSLHDMSVGVNIDDFGTGYSSLGRLKQLPVDEIKIDRSFVTDMARNDSDAAIVKTVIDLGRNLHLQIVAEGVEDQETWNMLVAMDCDMAQGYYLTRPLPATDFVFWHQQWTQNHLAG